MCAGGNTAKLRKPKRALKNNFRHQTTIKSNTVTQNCENKECGASQVELAYCVNCMVRLCIPCLIKHTTTCKWSEGFLNTGKTFESWIREIAGVKNYVRQDFEDFRKKYWL